MKTYNANRKCLDDILQDYVFIENDENNLRELLYGTFILYGKSLQIVKGSDSFAIKGFDFLELLYDLKNKQFKAYKIVFEKSKQPIYKLVDDMHTRKVMDILQYKRQIILQGPPGTGKTRLAREVASQLSTPMYIEDNDIVSNIHLGQEVFGKEKVSYRVLKIESRIITLELEGGSLKTCNFDGIKEAYFNYSQGRSLKGGDTYTTAIAIAVFNAVSYNTLSNNPNMEISEKEDIMLNFYVNNYLEDLHLLVTALEKVNDSSGTINEVKLFEEELLTLSHRPYTKPEM